MMQYSASVIILLQSLLFTLLISLADSNHWIIKALPFNIKSFFRPGEINRVCSIVTDKTSIERNLCLKYPNIMTSVIYGAQLGLTECGRQFKFERWNCSFESKNPDTDMRHLLEMSRKNIKETSFLYGIWSSGVVYSITNSCSRGHLKECYCDPRRHGQDKDEVGDFTWGGCSDHIKFGMKVGRVFLDRYNRQLSQDRILMDIHNNRVGRRAVWKTRLKKCKCHGVSGACSLRTCWQRMSDFRTIGQQLKQMYRRGQKVVFSRYQNILMLEKNLYRRPSRKKMVFLDTSPDFCSADDTIGHHGTGGRECNFTSLLHDSCSSLCCNRGHHTLEMIVEENCDCKFFWCCEVRCNVCRRKKYVYRCKH